MFVQMSRLKVSALLMLTICVHSEEFIFSQEKTIRGGLDVTPVCRNSSENLLTMIVCKIKRRRGEECRLLYQHGHDFEHECGQRFRLSSENRTVLLRLSGLTPEDGGIIKCDCSFLSGVEIHYLNVTVEEDEAVETKPLRSLLTFIIIGVSSFIIIIIIAVVILGLFQRKIYYGSSRRVILQSPTVTELSADIEPYNTFMQIENGLYAAAIMTTPMRTSTGSRMTQIYQNTEDFEAAV